MKTEREVQCPYCYKLASLVSGEVIYPHRIDLFDKKFWSCKKCEAYVGCHEKTTLPLGSLANQTLRSLRSKCHQLFDPLWRSKNNGITRSNCYWWLANKLDIHIKDCHIGLFDEDKCMRLLILWSEYKDLQSIADEVYDFKDVWIRECDATEIDIY